MNYGEGARGRKRGSSFSLLPMEHPINLTGLTGGRASLYPEARCRQNLDLRPGIDRGSESVNQSADEFLLVLLFRGETRYAALKASLASSTQSRETRMFTIANCKCVLKVRSEIIFRRNETDFRSVCSVYAARIILNL